jgi:hypothetical protein
MEQQTKEIIFTVSLDRIVEVVVDIEANEVMDPYLI